MRLIDAIAEASQVSGRNTTLIMRMGPCTAFTATTVQVNVDGTLVNAARLKGYSPAVGDQVVLLLQAGAWLALGSVPMSGATRDVESHQTLAANATVGTTETAFLTAAWDFRPGDVLQVQMTGRAASNGDNRQITVSLRENGVNLFSQVFNFTTMAAFPFIVLACSRIRRDLVPGVYTYTVNAVMNSFTGQLLAPMELSVVLLRGSL